MTTTQAPDAAASRRRDLATLRGGGEDDVAERLVQGEEHGGGRGEGEGELDGALLGEQTGSARVPRRQAGEAERLEDCIGAVARLAPGAHGEVHGVADGGRGGEARRGHEGADVGAQRRRSAPGRGRRPSRGRAREHALRCRRRSGRACRPRVCPGRRGTPAASESETPPSAPRARPRRPAASRAWARNRSTTMAVDARASPTTKSSTAPSAPGIDHAPCPARSASAHGPATTAHEEPAPAPPSPGGSGPAALPSVTPATTAKTPTASARPARWRATTGQSASAAVSSASAERHADCPGNRGHGAERPRRVERGRRDAARAHQRLDALAPIAPRAILRGGKRQRRARDPGDPLRGVDDKPLQRGLRAVREAQRQRRHPEADRAQAREPPPDAAPARGGEPRPAERDHGARAAEAGLSERGHDGGAYSRLSGSGRAGAAPTRAWVRRLEQKPLTRVTGTCDPLGHATTGDTEAARAHPRHLERGRVPHLRGPHWQGPGRAHERRRVALGHHRVLFGRRVPRGVGNGRSNVQGRLVVSVADGSHAGMQVGTPLGDRKRIASTSTPIPPACSSPPRTLPRWTVVTIRALTRRRARCPAPRTRWLPGFLSCRSSRA